MQFFTYIVECADGTFYTGKTINIEKRIAQHNGKRSGGARYTKTRRPVVLRYVETHESNKSAMQREIQLKQLTRKQKEKLIGINNTRALQ